MIPEAPLAQAAVSRPEASWYCTDARHALPCPLPCEVCAAECATAAGVTVTVTVTPGSALLRRLRSIERPFAPAP